MTTIVLPSRLGPRADLERRGDRGARRDADRDAFDAGQRARGLERRLVADRDHLVDDRCGRGPPARSPRRCPGSCAGRAAPPDRTGRVLRLDRDDLERGPARLQHLADAGDGAAGADAGDEIVDLAMRVVPDLLGRRAAVDVRDWPGCGTAAGMTEPGMVAFSSSARAIAPFMPSGAGSARAPRRAGRASCGARSTSIPA